MLFYSGVLLTELKGDLLVCGFNESNLFQFRLSDDGRAVEEAGTIEVRGVPELCRVSLGRGPGGRIYFATRGQRHRIERSLKPHPPVGNHHCQVAVGQMLYPVEFILVAYMAACSPCGHMRV